MKKRLLRVTACLMVVTLAAGSFTTGVEAASSTAGFSSYNANILSATITPTAGVSTTLSALLSDDAEDEILAEAQAQIRENETPVVTSEYADIAIAQVNNYVNVRSEANADSEVLGKLYNNSAATVLEVDGDWYLINSGSVTGYVKAEYVVVGDEELARSVSRRVATVTTETLKVRTEAGLDASVLGLVPEGDDLTVVDESIDGWVGVSMEEGEGYVSTDYVTLSTEYIYAESKAEEEARLAKEEAARKAAAAAAAAKSSSSSSSASSSSSSATTSYSAPSGSDGQAVVDYACQFVGNPYKYGGSSLTNGTDCSGFVMSVYAAFGVSLPHSSKSMRSVGYGVSVDEMQPGDIICYSGHVAIYVGNNTIVHASTPSTGIKYTSPANYKTILAVRRIF